MASAVSLDMPPFPTIALMLNVGIISGSSLFILADVVGPAATTAHVPSSLCLMIGPQWKITEPWRHSGTSLPSSEYSRARMCISSRPVTMSPDRYTVSPSFRDLTSSSESGVCMVLTASPPESTPHRGR